MIKYYLDRQIKGLGLKVFKRLEPLRNKKMTTATALKTYDLLIAGQLKAASGGKYFESLNPSTGEAFAQVADANVQDVREAITAARRSFDSGVWSGLTPAERGVYLKRLVKLIREEAKELAELERLDTGKTAKHLSVSLAAAGGQTIGQIDQLATVVVAPAAGKSRRAVRASHGRAAWIWPALS